MGGKGSGGHNRKPGKLREVQGNPGHRPINKKEPKAAALVKSDPPNGLNAAERVFWKQIFPLVSEMRVMTNADVLALTQLCRFLAEEQTCNRQIARLGRLIKKHAFVGTRIRIVGYSLNPICRLRSDAARHVRAYLAVFGLGPSFRSAIQVTGNTGNNDQSQDPLDDLFSGKDSSEIVQ